MEKGWVEQASPSARVCFVGVEFQENGSQEKAWFLGHETRWSVSYHPECPLT